MSKMIVWLSWYVTSSPAYSWRPQLIWKQSNNLACKTLFILKLKQLKYLKMSAFPPNNFWSAFCCKSMSAPISELWFWSVMHTHTHKLRSVAQRWPRSLSAYFGCCRRISVSFIAQGVLMSSLVTSSWSVNIRFEDWKLSEQKIIFCLILLFSFILAFVCPHSSVGYPTAAATRKTPTLALCGLYRIVPAFSQILQHLLPLLYEDSTMLSCPPFPPHPASCHLVGEKPERGRAGSTASGRRSGTQPANGRPCCPGRAQVPGRTKGSVRRRK